MELPGALLEKSVEEGKVYFFRSNCPIGVRGHLHICIKIHNRVFLFSSCTSQMATISRYVRLTGIDPDTYPCFPKNDINKFDEDYTFVNCNDVIECSFDEFTKYLEAQYIVPLDGIIDENGMSAIAKGIKLSKTVPKEIQNLF